MTVSLWRYAHLVLAVVSCLFITMASVTGAILSFEPVYEQSKPYKVTDFDNIALVESIEGLKSKYPQLTKLNVDANRFVTVEGFDEEGNQFKYIVHPLTGEILGKPIEKSSFIQSVTTLHRSLFLHETGRFIAGVFCFLLLLITVTGTILLIKRQKGLRYFFAKIHRDSFSQYYHTAIGRFLLIPILIITITGTYLFLLRFEIIKSPDIPAMEIPEIEDKTPVKLKDYPALKGLYLSDIKEIEFPFDHSAEEFYKIKTPYGEWMVDQMEGRKVQEVKYPFTKIIETISLDLHTGKGTFLWALVLGGASLNILGFIYTGFAITFKRKSFKAVKNTIGENEAEIVLLVGSENGSTLAFVQKIHQQLLQAGEKVYTAELNRYKTYPKMSQLHIFTSTHGLGDPPSNANQFQNLIKKHPQNQTVHYSVVGFGSTAYENFCGFAKSVLALLSEQKWAEESFGMVLVNERSCEDFCQWTKRYNEKYSARLNTDAAFYTPKTPKLQTVKVISNTETDERDYIFCLTLKGKTKFQSGDLLAVYPENDHRERLYSVAKVNGNIQLMVKLHSHGLGSQFLSRLKEGQILKSRIIHNPSFHRKKHKPVLAVANGTGIAPFLGMIDENVSKTPFYLYAGFRYSTKNTERILNFLNEQKKKGKLTQHCFAYSREPDFQYVMDLLKKDKNTIAEFLNHQGVIMVCGSLSMWNDVAEVLQEIAAMNNKNIEFYKNNHQILIDCY